MAQPVPGYARSQLRVTLSVWRALFLREALTRMSAGRAGWMWLILEPIAHIVFLMVLFSTIKNRNIPGADVALFLALGLTSFRLFRNVAQRASAAISANKALFSYRQVKPVDTVFVRCLLEGFVQVVVAAVLLAGCALFGLDVVPSDPLRMLVGLVLLWLLGVGLAFIVSAAATLVPEIGRVMQMLFLPLYLASGVLFVPAVLPPRLREWLLYNPIMHGLEIVRGGFFAQYPVAPGVSVVYLGAFVLAGLLLGLALHRRFALALLAK